MSRPTRRPPLLLALAALAVAAAARSQPNAEPSAGVVELVPLAIGDRWLFGDAELEPGGSLMVSEAAARGVRVEDGEGTTHQLAIDEERGLLLIETATVDGVRHRFEPPLALLPPVLHAGAVHTAESGISEDLDGEPTRRGTRRVEASIAAPAPLSTPAGEWRAWRITTRVTTAWEGDAQEVTFVEEVWYAPGVGPVRHRGLLLEAKVGDRLIPP
jgi:hypothetical protein